MDNPVAIIGAGLGGLMLARVLHVSGIVAAVYEADASSTARAQGGMLDIHVHNGQAALKAAKLHAAFIAKVHAGAQASRILDNRGRVLFEDADDGTGNRPEVPRGELRRLLLESLPEGTVQWGHKLSAAMPLDAGRHKLVFANGSEVTTELLVGADGAWSKVRPLLSAAKPAYAGTTFIETYLHDCDNRHKATAVTVGGGSMYAAEPGKAITAHREPNNVLHAYVALTKPEDWVSSMDFSDQAGVLARVAKEFEGWPPAITALIANSDTKPVPRPIHALPDGHAWAHTAGVTLVGDAAHLMVPSGEGANLAMQDGAELAECIAKHRNDVDAALRTYEAAMFTRSAAEASDAQVVFNACFGSNAPHSLVDFFRNAAP